MSKINAHAVALLLLTSAAHAQQAYPGGVRVGVWKPEEFLYTPADIQAMRERLAREPAEGPLHRMVSRGRGWLSRLAKPGYLEKLLPEGVPIHSGYQVGECPACAKATPRWQGRSEGHLACPECRTVFPNDTYPDTETMDLGGRAYRYALDGAGNPSNRSGSARYWQIIWTMKHDRPHQFLAIAYLLTGDRRFARAAADMIVRYARNWLTWPMLELRRDETGLPRLVTLETMRERKGYYGKLQWLDDSILLTRVAFAYGAIRDSQVMTEAEHRTVRDAAREALELNTFPHLYYRSTSFGNMHGVMYAAMIMAGRAFGLDIVCRDLLFDSFELNGVDLIHEAYDGPKGLIYACWNECDREGCHREAAPAYYRMMAAMFLESLVYVKDYTEPASYAPLPKVAAYWRGRRTLDPGREAPIDRLLGYYRIANSSLRLPGLNDSGAGLDIYWKSFFVQYLLSGRVQAQMAVKALQPERTTVDGYGMQYYSMLKAVDYQSIWNEDVAPSFPLFSGVKDNVGLAVLRGAGETDLYLNWDGLFASHIQYEQLGLILYAKGHETLLDFGYQGSSYWLRSRWTNRTIAHNTVTVDESVCCSVPRGRLERWVDMEGVRIVQASDSRAFPDLDRFRRTVALIDIDDSHAYCQDLFEVTGGKQHDQSWLVNGRLNQLEGAALAPRRGTLLGEDTGYKDLRPVPGVPHHPQPGGGQCGNGYGFIHKLATGFCAEKTWQADWSIEDSPMRLRITGIAHPDTTLIKGSCPFERMRPQHRTKEHTDKGKEGPIVIVRREAQGNAPASSFLAAAIEPFEREPRVASIRYVTAGGERGIEASVGPEGDRHDTLLVGDDGSTTYVSRDRRGLRELILMGRNRWTGHGWEVQMLDENRPGGTILAVNGRELSLLVDAALPAGEALAGCFIRASKPSGLRSHFLIEKVDGEREHSHVFVDRRSGTFAKNVGLVDEIVDSRTFITGTYFTASKSWGQIYQGDHILIGGQAYPVENVEKLGRAKRYRMKLTLATAAFPDTRKQGQQFILSALSPGERWQIELPLHIARQTGNQYRVGCAARSSVRPPAGIRLERGRRRDVTSGHDP